MHVVFVTSTYPPENGWGGIGSYVYHAARGLSGIGHTVTVLCGYADCPQVSLESGIRVVRRLQTGGFTRPIAEQVRRELERLIASDSVDLVEFPEHDALGIDFQLRHPSFPAVVRLHGDSELCLAGGLPMWKRIATLVYRRAELKACFAVQRESARRAHAVVSASHWLLGSCLQRNWVLPPQTFVVPNSFSLHLEAPAALERYEDKRVLWLARLDRIKGVTLLPSIARAVWREMPETEFHLIGQTGWKGGRDWSGWLLQHLPAERRRQMIIHGGVPYTQVLQALPEYSLAAFASKWESFSYTHLECMWAGLACVSASGSGTRELGRDQEHLVECRRRPAEIAKSLVALLRDPVARRQIGQAGSRHVREEFDGARVAGRMVPAYEAAQRAAAAASSVGRCGSRMVAASPR